MNSAGIRVIVAGAVAWSDAAAIRRELSRLPPGSTVVHGDCAGADALAGQVARELGLRVEAMDKNAADRAAFPEAAWKGLNERMLAGGAAQVLVFHADFAASRGSRHLAVLAEEAGIEVRVFGRSAKEGESCMPDLRQRIEGGLIGLLVGDALGVPYEFNPPGQLPPEEQIEMEPPAGFRRSYPDVRPGTWSDDGAQALCLLASLLYCGRMDVEDLGRRLINWRQLGYMAVDADVFDIGITTRESLLRLERGLPALQAGAKAEGSNGNGSLMRVLPLALWHRGSDEELIADAMAQSCVTHAHRRSQLCCALYCLWARNLLQGGGEPWQAAVAVLQRYCQPDALLMEELRENILSWETKAVKGSGYVVDCLYSARQVCALPDYEGTAKAAVALGHDTDTTACVAGGIAGVLHGIDGIPERWRRMLREPETVQPMLDALLARWD